MKCKFCGAETKVTDKRESPDGTRRRRECLKCKKRFTTYEKPEDKEIIVVKKDGRREHFVEDKVRLGLIKACEKRPVPMDKIDKIVEEIKEKLIKKGKEVKTSLIGELIMNKLKKLDKIAYIRFASVYKEFKDVDDFRNVVLGISDNTPKSKSFGCFKREVKGL
ncbi:MAG: transcriptional regulator NrdR [Nanoarchaeota archaeon]